MVFVWVMPLLAALLLHVLLVACVTAGVVPVVLVGGSDVVANPQSLKDKVLQTDEGGESFGSWWGL